MGGVLFHPALTKTIFNRWHQREISSNLQRCHIMAPEQIFLKTIGTFFPSTFKVWENIVPLVFSILVQRYSPLLNLGMAPCWQGRQKIRKRLYLILILRFTHAPKGVQSRTLLHKHWDCIYFLQRLQIVRSCSKRNQNVDYFSQIQMTDKDKSELPDICRI